MNILHNEELFQLYMMLNELYSINYSCLRIANQDVPVIRDEKTETPEKIYDQRSRKTLYIEGKLEEIARIRKETFDNIQKAYDENLGNLNQEEDLKPLRSKLIQKYNSKFKTTKHFKDIINGFEILDPEFRQIAADFNTQSVYSASDQETSDLLTAYYHYIDYMLEYMAMQSFDKILKTLSNDLTSSGRPSLYFRHPEDGVSTLSREELEKYKLDAFEQLYEIEKQTKKENKKLVPYFKRVRKDYRDSDAYKKISEIKSTIFDLNEKHKRATELTDYLSMLDARLESANSDYEASKSSSIFEGIVDLSAGINVFSKKNKLKIDSVYVHDLELSYLKHMFEMFKQKDSTVLEEQNQKQ